MREAKEHELKIWPEYFQPVLERRKTFEVRVDDGRNYQEGDRLRLREWLPTEDRFSGRWLVAFVKYSLTMPQVTRIGGVDINLHPIVVMAIDVEEHNCD